MTRPKKREPWNVLPTLEEHLVGIHLEVIVRIDPADLQLIECVQSTKHGSIRQVVSDEIQSNLESLTYVRRVVVHNHQPQEKLAMTVKFFPNDKGNPAGKIADAELHFSGGPLDGLKLVGFAIWERKNGGRNVTFPARQYTVHGERRSFSLLRPIIDTNSQDKLRDIVLEAFKEHEAELAASV